VERDLQVLGVRRWRELVIDRGKWRGSTGQSPQRAVTSTEEECLYLTMFINLYMFREAMCPSSGDTTVFVRHLVLVILYG